METTFTMGPRLQIIIFALLAYTDLPTSRAKVADAASGEGALSGKVWESVPVSRNKNRKNSDEQTKNKMQAVPVSCRIKHPCRENSSRYGNTHLRMFATI